MSTTFLQAVNTVFRSCGILRGDTDPITSFSNQQHAATIQLAMLAIQFTLAEISGKQQLPAERVSGSLTLSTGVRTYALPSDFMEFWNEPANFYDSVQDVEIFAFNGGEPLLERTVYDYKTETGYPNWFYMVDGPVKTVGFYQVPNSDVNGRVLTFDYNKNTTPCVETDLLPFQDDTQALIFCKMCGPQFDAMYSKQAKEPSLDVMADPNYINARASLLRLMNPLKPAKRYGRIYNGC